MLIRIRVPNQFCLRPLIPQKAEPKRNVRRHGVQVAARVLYDCLIRRVEAHGHGDDGRTHDSGDARGVRGGQNKSVEGVIFQGAENTAGAAKVEVLLISSPELRGGIVEAKGEGGVPDCGIAIWPVFLGEVMRKVRSIGEGVDVVWVGGELVEVFLKVDDEVGVEDDGGGIAFSEVGIRGEVGIVDDSGAGSFKDID